MNPLVVIPSYLREPGDAELLATTVASLHRTAGAPIDVLVVDDCSPAPELLDSIEGLAAEVVRKPENTGFSSTVNIGLRRALEQGRHAFLVNADIEMISKGWVECCVEQPELSGRHEHAAVVGALLLYPNKLIQHAGVYFSLLTRGFDHLYKYGPHNLPEARVADVRPVTGAFQFIRHETLTAVGLYDEEFTMGFEDVDYCIRVMLSGHECVYQPKVRAFHLESVFRGRGDEKVKRWQAESFRHLADKYSEQSFAALVPTL